MMPDMDGFQLAERIRQYPQNENCKLILLSSAGQIENSARCQELGVERYLIKPVKQSDLREAIVRILSPREQPVTGPAPSERPESRRSRRILLAEDGLVNQQVACQMLEARGHQVVVVNNGQEAVEALEHNSFDLVLMDVQMPGMDGFEATETIRLKEQGTGRRVPIIALTAHAMKEDRERCLKVGMDGSLPKPIQSKSLYEAVEGIATTEGDDSDKTADPSQAEPIMDWNASLKRLGGREDLLKQMVGFFFIEIAELLPALREAVARQDQAKVKHIAHAIKGSATCFSADRTVSTAESLEFMGCDGVLTHANEAYALLENEVDRLKLALMTFAPNAQILEAPGNRVGCR
jgi:CheY-like chemotaxis protein